MPNANNAAFRRFVGRSTQELPNSVRVIHQQDWSLTQSDVNANVSFTVVSFGSYFGHFQFQWQLIPLSRWTIACPTRDFRIRPGRCAPPKGAPICSGLHPSSETR
ncbi:hypothetical protein BRAS3809_400002 [Bradyrhizobium sp. STM 3809]|nr:hypothetical protein BRAS3809_400002 [Bradyrhizobium sp. STM 3809]